MKRWTWAFLAMCVLIGGGAWGIRQWRTADEGLRVAETRKQDDLHVQYRHENERLQIGQMEADAESAEQAARKALRNNNQEIRP